MLPITIKLKIQQHLEEKEFTKAHRERKRERNEEPNNYPRTRFILSKNVFKTPDLHKAIAFFLVLQIVIVAVLVSVNNPSYAGALNLVTIVTSLILITLAIREINRRQRLDSTRRGFRLSRVLMTIISMLAALFLMTFIFNQIGVTLPKQPNQMFLDALLTKSPVAMLLTMLVVAPIIEELVFRELLPYTLGPSYLSFAISSLLFVVLHAPFGLIGWTIYLILAAGFLYARLKDNNIYTAIAVHIIWNTISVIM